jgi:hypothetical protein
VKHSDNGDPAKLGCDELRYGLVRAICVLAFSFSNRLRSPAAAFAR